jgi:quinolinate synthase
VEKIKEMYCDAFLTAHLEVPGEMFSLAMEAKKRGMGVVGSTQNILDFIKDRVQESLDRNIDDHLQFVLGTESGMVTAIVAAVRSLLEPAKSSSQGANVTVEIVFPVSSESISQTTPSLNSVEIGDIILPVVPGVASGEGCSIHGGCASCPYMKVELFVDFVRYRCS